MQDNTTTIGDKNKVGLAESGKDIVCYCCRKSRHDVSTNCTEKDCIPKVNGWVPMKCWCILRHKNKKLQQPQAMKKGILRRWDKSANYQNKDGVGCRWE